MLSALFAFILFCFVLFCLIDSQALLDVYLKKCFVHCFHDCINILFRHLLMCGPQEDPRKTPEANGNPIK